MQEDGTMRKIYLFAMIISIAVMLSASPVYAAGSCTQSAVSDAAGTSVLIKFVCTGDSGDGSIPNTDVSAANMALILDKTYFYTMTAYPTSGGTPPDAADVQLLMNGLDLLGGKGTNLIHPTATKEAFGYSSDMGAWRTPVIVSTVTLSVANQATVSANYTIELVFIK
jgi:hypothetical protein